MCASWQLRNRPEFYGGGRLLVASCYWCESLMMCLMDRHYPSGSSCHPCQRFPSSRLGSTSHPSQSIAVGICRFNRAVHPIRQMDISWLIFNFSDARELGSFMAGRRANGLGLGIMGGYLGTAPWECCVCVSPLSAIKSVGVRQKSLSKTHCPAIDLLETQWRS